MDSRTECADGDKLLEAAIDRLRESLKSENLASRPLQTPADVARALARQIAKDTARTARDTRFTRFSG
jgi:hypothetical protein